MPWRSSHYREVPPLTPRQPGVMGSMPPSSACVSRSWNSLSKTAKNVILATTGLSALALAFHYGPGVPRDTKVVVTEPEGYRLTDVNASWQNYWPTHEVSQPGENQRLELHMPPGSEIMMTATNPDGEAIDVSPPSP